MSYCCINMFTVAELPVYSPFSNCCPIPLYTKLISKLVSPVPLSLRFLSQFWSGLCPNTPLKLLSSSSLMKTEHCSNQTSTVFYSNWPVNNIYLWRWIVALCLFCFFAGYFLNSFVSLRFFGAGYCYKFLLTMSTSIFAVVQ